jgi:putative tryptophan/tyrosine transport system substrate-binding protein
VIRRREFISGFAAGAALRPGAAMAQSPPRPLVAWVLGGSKAGAERNVNGFLRGMRELGYVEGQNWAFASRYADGDHTRMPVLAEELVRLKPDVIASGNMAGVVAFKKLTDKIPIVCPSLVDPVAGGLAASHARPGGNVTGMLFTVEDLPSKQLALAAEMVPGTRKIGLLVNPGNPAHLPQRVNMEGAAATLGIHLAVLQATVPDDLHAAFETLARERTAIVFVINDGLFLSERKRIVLLATAARLPTMFSFREAVEDGGLMSYGIDLSENFRRTAGFIGEILKGARAGDLPVEFPTKLELLINLMAAKVLALVHNNARLPIAGGSGSMPQQFLSSDLGKAVKRRKAQSKPACGFIPA